MEITYVIARSDDDLKHWAKRLLEHKVHHEIGLLNGEFNRILRGQRRKVLLCVAVKADIPVGVIFLTLRKANAMFYVVPNHRRHGYASEMLRTLRNEPDIGHRVIQGVGGDLGWDHFFKKAGVYCEQLQDDIFQVDDPQWTGLVEDAPRWYALYRKRIRDSRRRFKQNYLKTHLNPGAVQ